MDDDSKIDWNNMKIQKIIVSPEEYDAFIELLNRDIEPNDRLKQAAERYKDANKKS